jgi:WD40 repeat protein
MIGTIARVHAQQAETKAWTDLYGDPLPEGAIARLGTVRLRHFGVSKLAFLPAGKTFLSGSYESIRLWDIATGKELRAFTGKQSWAQYVAFAPDGKTAFTRQVDGFHRLNLDTGKDEHLSSIAGIYSTVSPDGKEIVTADGGPNRLVAAWDLKTLGLIRRFDEPPSDVTHLALSRDGKLVATAGSNREIHVWDASTGKALHILKGHEDGVWCVAFAPDGKTLASGSDDMTVRLWDTATGKELRQCKGHNFRVFSLCFSPDGRRLFSGDRGFIREWDPETAKTMRTLKTSNAVVTALLVSPDEKTLVSGDSHGAIRLWHRDTGKERDIANGMFGRIGSVLFLPDGKRIITGSEDSVRVWDALTGRELRRPSGTEPRYSFFVAVSPDGRLAASGGFDKKVHLWDVATGKTVGQLEMDSNDLIAGLAFTPDGKTLATTSYTGVIALWDVASGKKLRQMSEQQKWAGRVAFTPDGESLASASIEANGDFTIRFWETATGKQRVCIKVPTWRAFNLAISPDGKLLAVVGAGDRENKALGVRLWETATGKELPPLQGQEEFVMGVAFSPDGRTLATAGDKTIRLWEVATSKERAQWPGNDGGVLSLSFAPNGRLLVSGGYDTTGLVWDVAAKATRRHTPIVLSKDELERCWSDLASEDAGKAWQAIWELALEPKQGAAYLGEHIRPVPAADKAKIAQWIKDLDAEDFATRRRAARELEIVSELAEPFLRRALDESPSPELRRQVMRLLERAPNISPEQLRGLRGVEVLERIADPEAKHVLETLSKGAREARLTREAKAALDRLNRVSGAKPHK